MRLIIGVLILMICYSCNHKEAYQSKYHDLNSKIDSLISNTNFNGVIAVAKDTSIIYSNALGFSDFENKKNIKIDNQFVIGSISKQITAVLILQAYEKGKIRLEDTISKYLKDIKQPWVKDINIHQLLTHTHGIVALDQPLEFKQGSQFQYSQLGYELLAQILESITNKSFEENSTALFKLYGLNNTFHPKSDGYKNLVKGYVEENENLAYSPHSLYNYPAAGSFISNAEDLIQWNYLLYSYQLLKQETLELMKTRYVTRNHPIFETIEYGYGLLFQEGESTIEIGALGYAPGFVSASYFYPESQLTLVVLENTARNLNDFRETFKIHLKLMKIVKNERLAIQ
ncbi:MAG: serine hydrolase domain-containing protein [Saprospiraceae bacterium]